MKMKQIILFVSLLILPLSGLAEVIMVDETTFPDPGFRRIVLRDYCFDDNKASTDVLSNVSFLSFTCETGNTKGLEYFTGLSSLMILGQINSSIDFSHITGLQTLELYGLSVNVFDLSNMQHLSYIGLGGGVKELYLPRELQRIEFYTFECDWENIDWAAFPYLKDLYISNCQIKKLDLSKSGALERLSLVDCPVLQSLSLPGNTFKHLGMNGLPSLSHLDLSHINIPNVTLRDVGMTSLRLNNDCQYNTINIINCHHLQDINFFGLHVDELNVKGNTSLNNLNLNGSTIGKLNYLLPKEVGPLQFGIDFGSTPRSDLLSIDLSWKHGSGDEEACAPKFNNLLWDVGTPQQRLVNICNLNLRDADMDTFIDTLPEMPEVLKSSGTRWLLIIKGPTSTYNKVRINTCNQQQYDKVKAKGWQPVHWEYKWTYNPYGPQIVEDVYMDYTPDGTDDITPNIAEDSGTDLMFSSGGMRIPYLKRGLNIIRMNNGKVRKVLVRE